MTFKTDKELTDALKEPFPAEDIDWRVSYADANKEGKVFASMVAYIDARAVQNRLDEVCGVGGWWNQSPQYANGGNGVNQGITIRLPESGDITKWDGADQTDIEAVKGGLSGAFKRAAVLWGIGRYLYDIEQAYTAPQSDKPQDMDGWMRTPLKIGGRKSIYYIKKPTLPARFLPKEQTITVIDKSA